jgi:hypothetical protein
MPDISRSTIQGKDQQVLVGIQDELQSITTLHLGAMTFTPASLAAFVQRRIDLGNAVDVARAAWLNALSSYHEANAETNVVLADLRNAVMGAFGRGSSKLASFGFVAPKRPTLTPEQRAEAARRARATRKARRTLGKRQKAKIKGEPVTAAPEVTTLPTATA